MVPMHCHSNRIFTEPLLRLFRHACMSSGYIIIILTDWGYCYYKIETSINKYIITVVGQGGDLKMWGRHCQIHLKTRDYWGFDTYTYGLTMQLHKHIAIFEMPSEVIKFLIIGAASSFNPPYNAQHNRPGGV